VEVAVGVTLLLVLLPLLVVQEQPLVRVALEVLAGVVVEALPLVDRVALVVTALS
jgi:hypothetical protein